ncbi:hypothetical protein [Sphingopyxis indica]|uniref:Uncharacterized protein n=1 Tax=Sphingopyxis indica TaxID=436663 RepID=A0A239KRA3_9SPHN|nr:hypothetical protein [Sphingopyxis indica]SNT20133.1 hypothetical protein SAMN06295955_11595 [Sphingopyxis indica]
MDWILLIIAALCLFVAGANAGALLHRPSGHSFAGMMFGLLGAAIAATAYFA